MKLRSLFVYVAVVAGAIFAWSQARDFITGIDWEIERYVKKLEIGSSKNGIVSVMGEPSRTEEFSCLPNGPTASDRRQIGDIDAVEYLLWRNGANHFYCMGFDKDEKLVIVLTGSS